MKKIIFILFVLLSFSCSKKSIDNSALRNKINEAELIWIKRNQKVD